MGIFSKKFEHDPKRAPKQAAPAKDDGKKAEKADAPALKKGTLAKEHGGASWGTLIEPVLTEKASREQALGKYQFMVAVGVNKAQVAAAVRDLYGVKPVSVRMIGNKGKNVRFGRFRGRQKDTKKAIVTLKPGESLSAFETA
jgi:large subunit ribosomal protein L23